MTLIGPCRGVRFQVLQILWRLIPVWSSIVKRFRLLHAYPETIGLLPRGANARVVNNTECAGIYMRGSSVKSVGGWRLGKLAKCMIERDFCGSEGSGKPYAFLIVTLALLFSPSMTPLENGFLARK